MRRLFAFLLVAGLLLVVGCGGEKTIAPTDVPAPPKRPPTGASTPGANQSNKGTTAPAVLP